jgi:hypothetical protein
MTEEEWTKADRSTDLLSFAAGRTPAVRGWGGGFLSERKLRLVLVGCCRRHWELFQGPPAAVAETAERFADVGATAQELAAALQSARDHYAPMVALARSFGMAEYNVACAALGLCAPFDGLVRPLGHSPNPTSPPTTNADVALMSLCNAAAEVAGSDKPVRDRAYRAELAAQATLVRCVAGNPFRPVAFASEWRTDTAVSLAKQMYEAREFGAMPILADALQDAGCDNEDVLNHCREPEQHVRGCWVVDGVLGKE